MPLVTVRSVPVSLESSPISSRNSSPIKGSPHSNPTKNEIFSPPKAQPDFSPFKQGPFKPSSPLRPIPNFRSTILNISNVTPPEVVDEMKAKTKQGFQHTVERLQEHLIRVKTEKHFETHLQVSQKVEKLLLMQDLKESLRLPRNASPVRLQTPTKMTGQQLMQKIQQKEELEAIAKEQKKAFVLQFFAFHLFSPCLQQSKRTLKKIQGTVRRKETKRVRRGNETKTIEKSKTVGIAKPSKCYTSIHWCCFSKKNNFTLETKENESCTC